MKAELVGGRWCGREIEVGEPPPLSICVADPAARPGVLTDPLTYQLQRGWAQSGRAVYLLSGRAVGAV